MIDYDSFLRCHLTDIFFAFHAGANRVKGDYGEFAKETRLAC